MSVIVTDRAYVGVQCYGGLCVGVLDGKTGSGHVESLEFALAGMLNDTPLYSMWQHQ